jgi:hypothetical protein
MEAFLVTKKKVSKDPAKKLEQRYARYILVIKKMKEAA